MISEINILIIDHLEQIREELAIILRDKKYNLILVDSPTDALKIIRNQEIAILITEIKLPEMGGLELLKILKSDKRYENTYPIVVSERSSEAHELVKGLENGAVDYLLRPFEANLVKAKVETFHRLYVKRKQITHLLENILPKEIVREWETDQPIKPLKINHATVMFTDFIGFSKITKTIPPIELLDQLDFFFGKFDEISIKYGIEKIKTIGDAYMAVGGITSKTSFHELRSVLAALEINQFMKNHKLTQKALHKPYWEARIGLNSGPLVAGIIGKHKFSYDVWGDAVNAASRIESSGIAEHVNVSENVYSAIKDFFITEDRGKIEIKEGNKLRMYFVHGLKPEYQFNGDKHKPNKILREKLGMMHIDFEGLEREVINRLKIELDDELVYHSLDHTIDVSNAVERICKLEGVKGLPVFLLKTAALLHDTGFIFQYENNEEIGAKIAENFLHRYGYEEKDIEKVKNLILATKFNHQPKNIYEKIIRDADHDYLGRSDYHEKADKLRNELASKGKIMNDKEWLEMQIHYLKNKHEFYTNSALCMRQIGKEERIKELVEELKNYD